mmetsp:Transcript_3541/g.12709  ORF Transcript_3541/g.12709 Transcript_3541/m.12709 type:complete len:1714 (-) Transcript_3541:989-6130(-)
MADKQTEEGAAVAAAGETNDKAPPLSPSASGKKTYEELCQGLCPRALFCLTLQNPLRRSVVYIIKSKHFERFILFLILSNCIFLAMDVNKPNFEETNTGIVIAWSEIVFTVFFVLEMCLKIIGMGFYVGEGTYLKDGWNVMDFLVVILGLLAFTPFVDNFTAIRTVRVLRPLRTITGVEGMRVLVVTLLKSLPMLLDVLVLVSFAFFIFGIVGVQLFAEKMRNTCAKLVVDVRDPTADSFPECAGCGFDDVKVGDATCAESCVDLISMEYAQWVVPPDEEDLCFGPKEWKYPYHSKAASGRTCPEGLWCTQGQNPNFNISSFDTILWAWLTIFQCISLEGWTDIMYMIQDGVSPAVWIYFVIMIIFGSFFAVNLALAVLYLYFTDSSGSDEDDEEEDDKADEKDKSESDNKTADDEDTQPVAVTSPRLEKPIVRLFYNISVSQTFEIVTMCLIIINTVLMASEHHKMPSLMEDIYEVINYVLTTYFAIEMIIKLVGLGFNGYAADQMNIFDGMVVIFSFVEIGMNEASGQKGGSLSVLRSFRLLRVFKLARSWKQLNQIIATIFNSLHSISYLSLILLLFIFIFSLLGMQLFGYMFIFCDHYGVEGADYLCPPGEVDNCPNHYNCFVPCDDTMENAWVTFPIAVDPFEADSGGYCQKYTDEEKGVTEYLVDLGKSYVPRHNFDTFFWSIITIFQILTGENWNEVMYDGMRSTSSLAALYFLLLVVVGNYIILNLFLAILLDNFGGAGGDDDEDDEEESEEPAEQTENPPPSINSFMKGGEEGKDPASRVVTSDKRAPSLSSMSINKEGNPESPRSPAPAIPTLHSNSLLVLGPTNPLRIYCAQIVCHRYFEYIIIALICMSSIVLAIDDPELDPDSDMKAVLEYIDQVFVVLFTCEMILKVVALGFLLHTGSYLRSVWNQLDFLIVIVGWVGWMGSGGGGLTALRALRTFRALRPIRMASRAEGMKVVVNALFQAIPGIANVSFVCLLFYLIFGILGLNLFMGKYYYCEDKGSGEVIDPDLLGIPGNLMDKLWCDEAVHMSTCIGGSIITFAGSSANYTITEMNTGQSAFNEEYMRIEEWSLGRWKIEPSAAMVDEYGGSVVIGTDEVLAPVYYSDCEPTDIEHEWTNPKDYNFDNIAESILALFEMATLEGWLVVMYAGVDADKEDIDKQPLRDTNQWACIFFVVFIIVGSFFVMNLFVGVTIDKFNEMKEKQEGKSVFLTNEQRNWVSIQKLLVDIKPMRSFVEPEGALRKKVFHLIITDTFDGFILSMIMLNVVFMAMTHADMSETWEEALFAANTAFAGIFLIEAALKLFALGPAPYFRDTWNAFDFSVVCLSIVGVAITSSGTKVSYLSLLRIFRVARIFRLIPKAKGLRTLFQTLIFSLPALVNVGSVLFLFFFIFAVMGMNLFGYVKMQENITRHANFRNFPNALMLLFRMATGESWNALMHDCMITELCMHIEKDGVDKILERDGLTMEQLEEQIDAEEFEVVGDGTFYVDPGSDFLDGLKEVDDYVNECSPHPSAAIIYFIVFVILCAFVMLNLVIAVILDNFQNSNQNEEAPVGRDHVVRFCEVWSKLDPFASYYISAAKLQYLVAELDPPLGTKGSGTGKTEIQSIIMSVDIPNHNGKIHFLETLHALAGRIAGTELPEDEEEKIRGKIADRLPVFKDGMGVPKYTAAHYHAALYVQAAVRGFLARYQMRSKLAPVEERDGV